MTFISIVAVIGGLGVHLNNLNSYTNIQLMDVEKVYLCMPL